MRIVISFLQMAWFAGTETYILTIAGELERLGHDVLIYAPVTGPCADYARARGTRILERESELPAACDVVLAQDAATAYSMARRYPDAVRVFVAHSTAFLLASPPQTAHVCQAVVVMNDRVKRRTNQLGSRQRVIRLRQPIDLQRFCFPTLNIEQRRPPRVLLLSNHTNGTRARMIENACATAGLELRRVGAPTQSIPAPEYAIASSEIVISLGRGVLEAMAVGRAAYVFGDAGADGWVTADTYAALERDGFTGRANGQVISVAGLARDLSQWSTDLGEVGRDLACANHDVQQHVLRLLELVDDLGASRSVAAAPTEELARLVRLEWDQNVRMRSAASEIDLVRAEAAALRERIAEQEAWLAQLRRTRRYRLACLLARPLDRIRGALAARMGDSR